MKNRIKCIRGVFVVVVLAAALLSACKSAAVETPPSPETQAVTVEPTDTVLATLTDVPEEPNPCLDCHQDKQMLIDTGAPEEVVVIESKGEG